jgi:hypothetical protein
LAAKRTRGKIFQEANMAKQKYEIIHTVTTATFYYVEAESEEEAERMWDDEEIGPFAENSEPHHSEDVDGDMEVSAVVEVE